MSASSSGSDCCNNCGHALPTPGAKFCGECGKPQRQMKKCIQCKSDIVESAKFCINCGHHQQSVALSKIKPCNKCGNELPSSAPFCDACGQNQSQPLQQQQPCLYCGTPIPASSPCCPVCFAFTDPNPMRSIPLKQCINPSCRTTLMGFAPSCYKCNTNQTIPPQHSSPQSGMNPFLYPPAMFSMPSNYNMMTPQMKYCANCRGTLSESSDTCVHCQARQPMPTPHELLVMLQPFNPGPLSSYQAMPQSTPAIAARFPNQPAITSLVQSQPTPLFLQHSESTSLMGARFSSPPPRPMADPNRMQSQSTPVADTRQVLPPSSMKGVVPAEVTTSTTTSDSSSLSATSTPQLSTTVTVPEKTVEEGVNTSTMGPVDSNSIASSMEVDTSKGDATPPSLNPSARLEPLDDPTSSIPSTSSVDKDVTDEQDIDDQSPVGSKRSSDDESSSEHSKRSKTDEDPDHDEFSSEHSKRSKTDKDPDHEAIVPSRRISKRQLSNWVPQTDQVKRSKTEEDLTASGKEKDNEKPGASNNSPDTDSSANELGKDGSMTDRNNNVVDTALSSDAVMKEQVIESDSGINITESTSPTPSENNGIDGDSHNEKKVLKLQDGGIESTANIPERVQQRRPKLLPKEEKKESQNEETKPLDTNGESLGKSKGSSDDDVSPPLNSDEDDFIAAEEESSTSSTNQTGTLVPGSTSGSVCLFGM